MVTGTLGMALAMRGLSFRISLARQDFRLPDSSLASVVRLSWIDEPSERPVALFLRLIGNAMAPPTSGM